MVFTKEADFEEALINLLSKKGWEEKVLRYPTEADLLRNWADILYQNNNTIDRLNDCPLTDGEMRQILDQIAYLRTPLKLNGFINGKTISVKRDNKADKLHFGKEISLKIYDRQEIAAGESRYQIVQQPIFASKSKLLNGRRGDLMLLINGMPVIHIELKRSGIPVSQAYNQIEKYAAEGIFTGIFSLIQIFVAMEPNETVYFANPGEYGRFNKAFYFHWANFDNEPINDWKGIADTLLSIPMAHQLIGFYTVADDSDGILKVMRSYQYFAATKISDKVTQARWDLKDHQLGGYVWHTTGSGKTMTSFKSAQLIANSQDADKVVFLMDRIELGTQSLEEYRAFADESEAVQETEDTVMLLTKLKSSDPSDTLIVTSIQKMSRIKEDGCMNDADIARINDKRIVFIIDEAHRSTFGDMLITIKQTFDRAMFFGFTGTPIQDENQKKLNTTATVFGEELHRYSIADGIRDKNVLGFDLYKVLTYKDRDLRRVVALHQAKAKSEEEALADPKKREIYYKYMSASKVKMAGYTAANGENVKGIEDFLPQAQYDRTEHRRQVVKDIGENWSTLSRGGKFHAIFATASIPEAIEYYRLMKEDLPQLKFTALFDANIDNEGSKSIDKEQGLAEIIGDYNARYEQDFSLPEHAKFKKDVAARLAHKKPYTRIDLKPDEQLDILIVVDQMLTGFDSKWINTLYLDKKLEYEHIIQAFSRTNRLFGHDKPFGTIRYYRWPHTMEVNIEKAVKLYSGDKPLGLFVEKLGENIEKMNAIFHDIKNLFISAGIPDMAKLPEEKRVCGKFALLFKDLNTYLDAAKVQGFRWDKQHYTFGRGRKSVDLSFDENAYLILAQRYKELFDTDRDGTGGEDVPFEVVGYLTEIDTGIINADYMQSRFEKYLKVLNQGDDAHQEAVLNELYKSFASLTQNEQKYANVFLHDVRSGSVEITPGRTLRDYIALYMSRAKNEQIEEIVSALGVDSQKLLDIMSSSVNEANLNDFDRFGALVDTLDTDKAKDFFAAVYHEQLSTLKVRIKARKLLKEFILKGGFDIKERTV